MIWRLAFATMLVLAAADKRSGYQDASPETRAMQDDDASNPGFLWVQQGETLWAERTGNAGRSCADCHASIRGVAARYPVFDARLGRPITLAQRIQQCRVERQGAGPLAPDSDALLGLTAYVGLQSPSMVRRGRSTKPARHCSRRARASSTCPVPSVMMVWQASGLPAASFRKDIRTGIRNIGWSGRVWARSNGASATA